uniref:Aquaporin n=1 Tax=Craspedostauros australis TaxID=1486917 RepID=A0A7R9WQP2_9STRA|mmetsp:Transcript_1630/g.4468  ORF Transcript_1630/g.4468 Transcript_1630/m.4468 type:complete len:286 (+) Transcript_1630:109-966(+)|eukprot:CAMPEP_0198120172 /NCGR_PEP_ID=MMETSP1442-20131203/28185_1 /TAXON_ID= /ORGANISM="Craspedostauros australis, Strain CCMP3328" /LENGTH=285 /DNA_ID=CAMNT_0043778777 /DNA_START=108 /DNA_END=965 /DNA_ORIENTATION=+
MVESFVIDLYNVFTHALEYLPPGIVLSVAAAFIGEGKHIKVYFDEFVGSILMIAFTFSAGKWIGQDDMYVAWGFHAVGVIAADYFGGGQQVNPAVTASMWALGECSYTEAFVRVAGQMGGGLVSFPLFQAISESFEMTPFGGPEFSSTRDEPVEATLSEFFSTYILLWAIYILNWRMHFGKHHYLIKQFLTAVAIRVLIEVYPTAGPAMNPMLATAWDTFGVGNKYEMPSDHQHYFVYWVAPVVAAILASISYAIVAGGTIFGVKMPIGPLMGSKKVAAPKVKSS